MSHRSDVDPASRADRPSGDEGTPVADTFVRGLTVGALIGAAVAGSFLFRRRVPWIGDVPSSPNPDPAVAARPPAPARRP